MSEENQTDNPELLTPETSSEQYSVAMVDTIFADTLSRGMQNAITSQQNAQMASASSVTNACARILQAKAKPIEGQIQSQPQSQPQSVPHPHPGSNQTTGDGVREKPLRKEVKAPHEAGAKTNQPTDSERMVVEETEKTIVEESQPLEALSADKQGASSKQSGTVSSNKLLLMLVASASLSAVIAGVFVSTYLAH